MTLLWKVLLIFCAGCLAASLAQVIALLPRPTASTEPFTLPHIDTARLKAVLFDAPHSRQARLLKLGAAAVLFIVVTGLSHKIVLGLMAGAGIYVGLTIAAARVAARKIDLIDEHLIEVLGMIANSVKTGQSLMQALESASKNARAPLSTEFGAALHHVRLGMPMAEALAQIPLRIPSREMRIALTAINLARESGGNLGEILNRIAQTIRERRKIQGKISALTAQSKASGLVMGCVPFVLLGVLYFIEPGLMGLLFTTVAGNIMLLLAVVMVGLGMYFIKKIVSIDI